MTWVEIFGSLGGFLTTISMIPQIWRIFEFHRAHDISMTFTILFNLGIFFWLLYGIMYGLTAIIIWNGIALVLGVGMIYGKVKWGRR
jgi:MtN3 and saliva related transmembrane protein